jgi:hypothetical protein
MPNKQNRTNTQALDGQIIVGIKKDLQNVSTLPLNGKTYTPATLTAFIQSRIDAANEATVAKAKFAEATKAYQAVNTEGIAVVHDLKQYVMSAFGRTASQLADFGFTPPKPKAVLTTEQKAAAVQKRAATRAARGTKGPVAKLTTTGETVRIAALEAAAAKNAGPAPAPAAPAAGTAAPTPATSPAPVLAPTVAPTPATQPAPANGAPTAATASKA